MKLHDIKVANPRAWIWCFVRGGNGRRITRYMHLFPIQRQTPTNPIGHEYRRYFQPWRFYRPENTEAALTPACGRLPSRAQYPSVNDIYGRNHWNPPECPDCATRQRGQYINEANANDPWHQIPPFARAITPDPITGR